MARHRISTHADGLLYVIHKHNATHVHYDLRLEVDGKLFSWALPKLPTNTINIKRLAIHTAPHDLSYALFEGVIPENEYGTGTVMVWDLGTYKSIKQDGKKIISVADSFGRGIIEIEICGEKLNGIFALVKMKQYDQHWLLLKIRDAQKRYKKILDDDYSVLTGRTMKQIEQDDTQQ